MIEAIRNTHVVIGIKANGTTEVRQPPVANAQSRFDEFVGATESSGHYTYVAVVWYGSGRMVKTAVIKGLKDSDGGGTSDVDEIAGGKDKADPSDD